MTAENVRLYGKVYEIITSTVREYVSHYPGLYTDIVRATLRYEFAKAVEENPDFPERFFNAMAHVIIRWMDDGFRGITKDTLISTYNEVWKFQKSYLLRDSLTGEEIIKALETIDQSLDVKLDAHLRELYIAVLEEIEQIYLVSTQDEDAGDQGDAAINR